MKSFTILILACTVLKVSSQPVTDTTDSNHSLQLGIATVSSQSIYLAGDSQSKIFPAIDYQYQRFYFQAGDLGYKFINSNKWQSDFGLGVNLAGDIDRGDSQLLEHLPDLSIPVSAFISIQYKSSIGLFKIKHNYEINNKHNGHSTNLSYAAAVRRGKWLFVPKLSYVHHSAEVVNYFYGISSENGNPDIPAYQTDSTQNFQLSMLGLRQINNKWSFITNLQIEKFGDEVENSPIVEDDQRLSVFGGFLYKFF